MVKNSASSPSRRGVRSPIGKGTRVSPPRITSTDTSDLTEDQQKSLCLDFMAHGGGDGAIMLPVTALRADITVELTKGWRTRPVYIRTLMCVQSARGTKHGVVWQFTFTPGGDDPGWVHGDGFKIAEMTYDKALEVFGNDFARAIATVMGCPWETAVERVRNGSVITDAWVGEQLNQETPAPPQPRAIEALPDWGDW